MLPETLGGCRGVVLKGSPLVSGGQRTWVFKYFGDGANGSVLLVPGYVGMKHDQKKDVPPHVRYSAPWGGVHKLAMVCMSPPA